MQAKLAELVDAVPSLGRLPPGILERLDLSELRVPRGHVADARATLERQLGCHVMVYERSYPDSSRPDALHLCGIATAAPLTPAQLDWLQAVEAAFEIEQVSFVAYDRLYTSPQIQER